MLLRIILHQYLSLFFVAVDALFVAIRYNCFGYGVANRICTKLFWSTLAFLRGGTGQ